MRRVLRTSMEQGEGFRNAAMQGPLLMPEQLLASLEVRWALPRDARLPREAGMIWARKSSWAEGILLCPTPRN